LKKETVSQRNPKTLTAFTQRNSWSKFNIADDTHFVSCVEVLHAVCFFSWETEFHRMTQQTPHLVLIGMCRMLYIPAIFICLPLNRSGPVSHRSHLTLTYPSPSVWSFPDWTTATACHMVFLNVT